MTWDSIATKLKEQAEKSDGGGLFLALKEDGDRFEGVVVGEPIPRTIVFNPETNRTEVYNAEAHGELRPKNRYSFQFYVPSAGDIKVFESTAKFANSVLNKKKEGRLDGNLIRVTRNGRKGDTSTTYEVEVMGAPDAETAELMKTIKPVDWEKVYK